MAVTTVGTGAVVVVVVIDVLEPGTAVVTIELEPGSSDAAVKRVASGDSGGEAAAVFVTVYGRRDCPVDYMNYNINNYKSSNLSNNGCGTVSVADN